MKILLFEDNIGMSAPRLLYKYLGDNVIFTKGVKNIAKTMEQHINDEVICFIDYVPDNVEAMSVYNEIASRYGGYDNIKIVKIPCIEVFAYLLLDRFAVVRRYTNSSRDALDYVLYNTVGGNENYIYQQKSFEKYIKSLTEVQPRCVNTSNTRDDNFYNVDCNCGYSYCEAIDKEIANRYKFNILYDMLPVRFNISSDFILTDVSTSCSLDWKEIMSRYSIIACKNILANK